MTYLVVDIETSVDNTLIGEDRASPFYPENKAVLIGWKESDEAFVYTSAPTHFSLCDTDTLVGQNIRFDIHYLLKHFSSLENWLYNPAHEIWDTQLAEYILTAQQSKYASLDELASKYGGTLKDSRIKDYWDSGVRTEDIPVEELSEYLKQDVLNTELVYLQQLELAEMTGMLPLIKTQMKCLVATWEMAKNGMCFDLWQAMAKADALEATITQLEGVLLPLLQATQPHLEDISATSNDVLSRALFGGSYSYYEQVPVLDEAGQPVLYKSGIKKGQVKTKKEEKTAIAPKQCIPLEGTATAKAGFYQVGEHILTSLLERKDTPATARTLIEATLKLRAAVKDRETYFIGFSKLAWPEEFEGCTKHFIHGKINHTSTDTGRTSSSSPNLQNLSNKDRE